MVSIDYNATKLVKIFVKEIVRLYRVPISIGLDRSTQFTSNLWKIFQSELGSILDLGIVFRP